MSVVLDEGMKWSVSAFALVVVVMMAGEDSFSGCVDEGN